jgi:hypothetical protein
VGVQKPGTKTSLFDSLALAVSLRGSTGFFVFIIRQILGSSIGRYFIYAGEPAYLLPRKQPAILPLLSASADFAGRLCPAWTRKKLPSIARLYPQELESMAAARGIA